MSFRQYFPPASAVTGIKSVPSVCQSVCPSASALTAEPCDLPTYNLVWGLPLMISWMRSKFKVTRLKKCFCVFWFDSLCHKLKAFCNHMPLKNKGIISCNITMVSYGVTPLPRCHTVWRHHTWLPMRSWAKLAILCHYETKVYMVWRHRHNLSALEGLWGKNTDKDTSREGASTLRRFHFQ